MLPHTDVGAIPCRIVIQRIILDSVLEEDEEGKGRVVHKFEVILSLETPNGDLFPFSEEPFVMDDDTLPPELVEPLLDFIGSRIRPLFGGPQTEKIDLTPERSADGFFLGE